MVGVARAAAQTPSTPEERCGSSDMLNVTLRLFATSEKPLRTCAGSASTIRSTTSAKRCEAWVRVREAARRRDRGGVSITAQWGRRRRLIALGADIPSQNVAGSVRGYKAVLAEQLVGRLASDNLYSRY